jgi:hypothetical protein
VELRGEQVVPHLEHLNRAVLRRGEQAGVRRQGPGRLLVPDERPEPRLHALAQGVLAAGVGQLDDRRGDRLRVRAVHLAALVPRERADPVAGAEEREVLCDDDVQERRQLGLHAQLGVRLRRLRHGPRERAAADDDPGQVPEVDVRHRAGLQPDAHEVLGAQPAVAEHEFVLAVRDRVLGAGRQQQEGLHDDRS